MADVRVSRANVEILATADDVRVSRANVEVLFTSQDIARTSHMLVETIAASTDNLRVSHVLVETLSGFVVGQADVALYAYDTGAATVTGLAAWMTSYLGWTVTIRDDSTLSAASDLDDFDVLVAFYKDGAQSYDARAKAEAAGIPFALLGFETTFTEGTGKSPPPNESDLTGTWEFVDNTPGVTQINIVDNTHPITSAFSTGLLTVQNTADYSAAVDDGASTVGDVLAEADSNHANYVAGQATLIAVETGTDDLQGTPVATTERGLIWGFPYTFSDMTANGNALMTVAFQWLLGEKPLRPSIISATPSTTYVALAGSNFEHAYLERTHMASRWQVTLSTDTTWSSAVYDSGYIGDLTSHTLPAGTLDYDTSYIARVLYTDDASQDSEWSADYSFSTDDLVAGGGAIVEFYTSGDSLISSVNAIVDSTTYTDVTIENITIPATTAYIRVSPYKDGSGTKKGYTRRMAVDLGAIPAAYHPFAFRPEAHTDETIESAYNASADASSSADVDWSQGRLQSKLLDQAATTLTFSNVVPGRYVLILVQDGSGSRTVTWPGAVKWAGGTAPTLSTGTNAIDVFELNVRDSSNIYGQTVALNVS